jgi:hypothetical protein
MKKILIPADSGNEEIKVIHFQHNGIDVYVPVGKVTKVPNWVIEKNPNYAKYEVK